MAVWWLTLWEGGSPLGRHRSARWTFAEGAPQDDYIEPLREKEIHPVLAQVLFARDFQTPDAALAFLRHYDEDENPFRMKGMVEAVYRLRLAIRREEPIAVYGDFDCDGVCSTVLLVEVLRRLGAKVREYIPDRVDEGYGLNSPALKKLADDGVRLVVTVDCGIRSVQEVEDGNRYGLDMIITDHHSVGRDIPPALAVINPKQPGCSYPEKMLAGVGLAYKLAQGLFMEAQRRGIRAGVGWRPEDWLDLVAIGTVADIAPLRGENRALVQAGLKALNLQPPQRAGVRALYAEAGVQPGKVNAMTIGFAIGPRVNAAGRLRNAKLAFDLLSCDNSEKAAPLAGELNAVNVERQQKTLMMQQWAEEVVRRIPGPKPEAEPEVEPEALPLLFAADERFEQGIVGLVASRLTDQHYRPSVVIQVGSQESHGSCRSIQEFHITHALEKCEDLLVRFGGHAAAAGFTVRNENIDQLGERLRELAAEGLADRDLAPSLEIDAELDLADLSFELLGALERLEPTGEANPTPLFLTRNLRVVNRFAVGKDGQHLKLQLSDGERTMDAIAFRLGEQMEHLPDRVDVVYYFEANEWNGRKGLQMNVQDIRPAGIEIP
jgi:single-stranded-DNA-specific exonuclease